MLAYVGVFCNTTLVALLIGSSVAEKYTTSWELLLEKAGGCPSAILQVPFSLVLHVEHHVSSQHLIAVCI